MFTTRERIEHATAGMDNVKVYETPAVAGYDYDIPVTHTWYSLISGTAFVCVCESDHWLLIGDRTHLPADCSCQELREAIAFTIQSRRT